MSAFKKVPLDSASRDQLFFFARSILNLEVGDGANNATLRAKITQAQPSLTEITVEDSAPTVVSDAEGAAEPSVTNTAKLTTHFRDDPKVRLTIMPTTESTRAKEVQIACQGETIIARRGQELSIPYRHYLVLKDAIERVARDTDELNPQTGLPIKEWVDQQSYPYQVHAMPSPEEIAAWDKRLSSVELA